MAAPTLLNANQKCLCGIGYQNEIDNEVSFEQLFNITLTNCVLNYNLTNLNDWRLSRSKIHFYSAWASISEQVPFHF